MKKIYHKIARFVIALFTTYDLRVTIFLKSGDRIVFRCDEINIMKCADGTLKTYTAVGAEIGKAFYVNINDISAITYDRI